MPEVMMPRLSDAMEEGTIIAWLKGDGDEVTAGEDLVEIETDKATMVYQAEDDGPLTIVAADGATVAVGQPIAHLGSVESTATASTATADPMARTAKAGAAAATAEPPAITTPPPSSPTRAKASPIARRLARELGIDLNALIGTGPRGRIVKADVEGRREAGRHGTPSPGPAVQTSPRPTAHANSAQVTPAGRGTVRHEPLSRIQQRIAERMVASRVSVPDFTISMDIDMAAAVELRVQLTQAAQAHDQIPPSLNDLVVKAAAVALHRHPRANSAYVDGAFELYDRVNVGFAVAAEEALVVPVLRDAATRSMGSIAGEARRLAERARSGTLTPDELADGTFTVSNLGMFGVLDCTPVVNSGQAAILGVGALRHEPVVQEGELVAGQRMRLTLVCDHRVLYGADAARLLGTIRDLLQSPLSLML
jgi:pyruvate dehydrogenase E2 component (dihydrolipoamide acetyltransferase)